MNENFFDEYLCVLLSFPFFFSPSFLVLFFFLMDRNDNDLS